MFCLCLLVNCRNTTSSLIGCGMNVFILCLLFFVFLIRPFIHVRSLIKQTCCLIGYIYSQSTNEMGSYVKFIFPWSNWAWGLIICNFSISKKRNEKTIYSLGSTLKLSLLVKRCKSLLGKEQCQLLWTKSFSNFIDVVVNILSFHKLRILIVLLGLPLIPWIYLFIIREVLAFYINFALF